jgi:heme/copper-type cytochrome/quinol oxidase subunit 4
MTLKQFLKPDWRKIVVFVLISFSSITLTIFLNLKRSSINGPPLITGTKIGYPIFLDVTYKTEMENEITTYEWNFINLIFNIIIWYLLSCFIIWVYDKLKKKV